MARFTFLELHLHESDLQFGPKSMGDDAPEETLELGDVDISTPDGVSRMVPVVIGLAFLLGIGALVRRFRGKEPEALPEEAIEVEL